MPNDIVRNSLARWLARFRISRQPLSLFFFAMTGYSTMTTAIKGALPTRSVIYVLLGLNVMTFIGVFIYSEYLANREEQYKQDTANNFVNPAQYKNQILQTKRTMWLAKAFAGEIDPDEVDRIREEVEQDLEDWRDGINMEEIFGNGERP